MENQLNTRPIGVWCYDKSTNKLVKTEDWTDYNESGGVVVVTEDHAFCILPHPTFVGQWGDYYKNTSLCRDKGIKSGKELTDKIINTYKNVEYKSKFGEQNNFIGSPAAEFCKSVGGYLPSIVELKLIAKDIEEINSCMRVMGQPMLPIGWYWSSIEEDSPFALHVSLDGGYIDYGHKSNVHYVHAISEFEI